VYDPKLGEAGAYLAENDASGTWKVVSVAELVRLSGVDAFPALPPAAKEKAMALPQPAHGRGGEVVARERAPAPPGSGGSWLSRLLTSLFGSR
jgi:hypothetical protein